ncbi:hypothetical protein DPEC_G00368970 [Dallia pectoralis]|nr:hypothetical protein DPEC_G00368970 [Dallia pectoralis]
MGSHGMRQPRVDNARYRGPTLTSSMHHSAAHTRRDKDNFQKTTRVIYKMIQVTHHLENVAVSGGNAKNWLHTTLQILEEHYLSTLQELGDQLKRLRGSDWTEALAVAKAWGRKNLGRKLQQSTLDLVTKRFNGDDLFASGGPGVPSRGGNLNSQGYCCSISTPEPLSQAVATAAPMSPLSQDDAAPWRAFKTLLSNLAWSQDQSLPSQCWTSFYPMPTTVEANATPSILDVVEKVQLNMDDDDDEEEEEREGSQQVSVSEMSGTQPTEESRPGSAGPAGSGWRAGGAPLSELDSEEVSCSQQGASELSAPGLLEGTESTDDLGDASLKGAVDIEGMSASGRLAGL